MEIGSAKSRYLLTLSSEGMEGSSMNLREFIGLCSSRISRETRKAVSVVIWTEPSYLILAKFDLNSLLRSWGGWSPRMPPNIKNSNYEPSLGLSSISPLMSIKQMFACDGDIFSENIFAISKESSKYTSSFCWRILSIVSLVVSYNRLSVEIRHFLPKLQFIWMRLSVFFNVPNSSSFKVLALNLFANGKFASITRDDYAPVSL